MNDQSINRKYGEDTYDKQFVDDEREVELMPVLIQAKAVLNQGDLETVRQSIIKRLALLALSRPTQNMQAEAKAALFAHLARKLVSKGFSYEMIEQGIDELDEREKDKFFPNMEVLMRYIYPIWYQHKRRTDKLEEMLTRRHRR